MLESSFILIEACDIRISQVKYSFVLEQMNKLPGMTITFQSTLGPEKKLLTV